ncbi:serine/threonine-protein kinase [Pseudomonas sp. 43(2021)]|uniref:serine/threonine-protein kinase n=1 Tax=Pseudomonas sp. 43(2021) TaxID=2813560 RepID=UPI001A9FEF75|nr:serine/threonine-protein kinase [Pseudomonas sp. 43(2021)]
MLIADRYETAGVAHFGGMGKVLQCRDIVLERQVALKIMPGDASRRRINDEVGALFKMRSKNVVQLYDVLQVGGELAIVQEYVSGADLFDDSTSPQSLSDYLKMLWQIASGLSDIHKLGVIHRDIKPNNMKVDSEGVLKIFDFGLARDEGDGAATMGFVGTHGFAAPELYGLQVRFTAAVDVFAFGATALFLGSRSLPDELLNKPPTRLNGNVFAKLKWGVSTIVAQILQDCLDVDPAKRPSMAQVRDVLAKYLLQDRHRALVVYNNTPSFLDSNNRSVVLNLPNIGFVEIHYDGFDFVVVATSGDVFINNMRVSVGFKLPGACVVALGAPEHRAKRRYITFDLSHPEIVL